MVKRVFLPFLAVMVALTLFVFWRASRITSDLVENEYWKQMDRISLLLVEHPYLLNPTIQSQIEELVNAKIGYYDRAGVPHALARYSSSMDHVNRQWPVLSKETLRAISSSQNPLVIRPAELADNLIILSKIMSAPDHNYLLGLMVSTGQHNELQKNLFLALATNAALSLLVILILTLYFSKLFSRQLDSFLTTMEQVAEGKLQQQVPVTGSPEWKRLATAFNSMVSRLQHYQQRLRTSERLAAAGELSAILAHEVRNPLTSLKMLGQVLKTRHIDEPATVKLIEPMLSEVDRIELLVSSILDWSRPSPPQFALVDLNALVSDIVSLTIALLSRKEVKIIWEPGDITPAFADQAQMKQVIWNLLKNAENVSSRGDSIHITTSMLNENMVQLTVMDMGPGIDEKHKDKIFEPFFTTRIKGLGLGLTISRRIIEKHGGSLHIENNPHGGAKAIVSLPIQDDKHID